MRARTIEWMQSANAELAKPSVSKIERTFQCCSTTTLFKIIAKSDKKPLRHFIRSEAFANEKGYLSKKGQATELTRF